MNRRCLGFLAAALLIVAIGGAYRFVGLERKAIHHDECVNYVFTRNLLNKFDYKYNPTAYHGPFIYYVTAPLAKLAGFSKTTLRLPAALFGLACIGGILWMRRRLGGPAALFGAAVVALSPADVYYNKTYIHETFFTLSLVGMVFAMFEAAGVRPIDVRDRDAAEAADSSPPPYRWAAPAFYVFLVLGFLNKETAAFHVVAFAAAIAAAWFAAARSGGAEPFAVRPLLGLDDRRRLIVGLGVAFALWALFFSSFFTNPRGLFDFFAAYLPWFQTGVEKPAHVKAWHYFFRLVGEYYWPALPFAAWALVRAIWKRRPSLVALAVIAVAIQTIYSVIPYKTPWCIISIGVAWTLLGAAGFGDLWALLPGRLPRVALAALVLAGLVWYGGFSYQLNFVEYDYNHNRKEEPQHDIVYVQTQREYEPLYDDLARIAAIAGMDERLPILVSAGSKNPGRFYLRDYKKTHVVFTNIPKSIRDAVVIVRDNEAKKYAERYEGEYFAFGSYPVFPGWIVRLMVREELWQKLQAAGLVKTPPPDPS